jgi:endonuclease/exonuclease/phosphatase family metal-dependent hydrolase
MGVLCLKRITLAVAFCALSATSFGDNLRIATWNISDFDGDLSGQNSAVQTALFGTFQGRSLRPDVLFAQEIQSAAAANTMVGLLNSANGSTGDWAVSFGSLTGTGSTSDTAMFYRSSKVNSVSPTLVAAAAGVSGNPRDVWRFDFSITGNLASTERFAVYNVHMKSGTSTTDQDRREVEAQAVRANSSGLAANFQRIILGDLNMQSSNQQAWQTLTAAGAGRFVDPIGTPGSWTGSNNFRFVHTQDPSGGGGMDDRLDAILMGSGLGDGSGTEYVGAFGTTYSTSTWNDANHSYRVWGNDGTSFNTTLTVNGNAMVGSTIAQALVTAGGVNGGHLPVFADIRFDAVPEPATMLVLAGIGLFAARRRRNT